MSSDHLADELRQLARRCPDMRTGKNTVCRMEDVAPAAFSSSMVRSPPLLAHQRAMSEARGRSNAHSLFGLNAVPTDDHIRDLLDEVARGVCFRYSSGSSMRSLHATICPRFVLLATSSPLLPWTARSIMHRTTSSAATARSRRAATGRAAIPAPFPLRSSSHRVATWSAHRNPEFVIPPPVTESKKGPLPPF